MRFHVQGQSNHFKAMNFGLSIAPKEFTVVAKEVELIALPKGKGIHQYLDDWLVRARSHQTSLQYTQTLVAISQELCWLVNMEKLELDPKEICDFVGYQFDLKEGKVRPTLEHWQTLNAKSRNLSLDPFRQLISLIGLLTGTEKQFHLGRLHMRLIQWHLKNNWRVPETLEKVICIPRSLHPHLKRWLQKENILQGQPLHPFSHALQILQTHQKGGALT